MSAQPILLLHGALGSAVQLKPLADLLAGDFAVYAFDFAGHGSSPLPSGDAPLSIELFAAQVRRFLEQNELQSPPVFGYSMGGYVALYLARHYPDSIGQLITLGTKLDWTPETAERECKMLDPEKILAKVPAFAQLLAQRHGAANWQTLLHKIADMLRALGMGIDTLQADDFKRIQHQVLLCLGNEDNMVGLAETEAVAAYLPQGRVQRLAHCKHPFEEANIPDLAALIRERCQNS